MPLHQARVNQQLRLAVVGVAMSAAVMATVNRVVNTDSLFDSNLFSTATTEPLTKFAPSTVSVNGGTARCS